MANATSVQLTEDGARNSVVKVEVSLDTFPLGALTVLDPTTVYSDPLNPVTQFRVNTIDYTIQDGLVLILQWDATTPVQFWALSGRGNLNVGQSEGGLQNNSGAGKTGKITVISNSPTAGTYFGTFQMWAVKQ